MKISLFKSLIKGILNVIQSRVFIFGVIVLILFALLFHKLFVLQIVEGEDYLETFTYRIKKESQISAPRGSIYDSKGNVLAYDRLSYNVIIEDSTLLSDNESRNSMIQQLIKIVEKNGYDIINNMPFILNDDNTVDFTGSSSRIRNFKKDIFGLNYIDSLSEKQDQMTGQELFDYMKGDDFFEIDSSLDQEAILKIMSIRYELYMKRYQKYVSVTVVSDVNDKMVASIKENGANLPGVTIEQDYVREYVDSVYFAHITGYTGTISEDQLIKYKEEGHDEYSANDIVGKTGIEYVFEYELSGAKGSQTLYVNSLGSVLDATDIKDAIPGNDVHLTIDADLTKTIYNLLEEKLAGILLAKLVDVVEEDKNENHMISYAQVFHKLIDNGIISTEHFYESDATELEYSVGKRFDSYIEKVILQIKSDLTSTYDIDPKEFTTEYKQYYKYIYTWLKNASLLNGDLYSAEEEYYKQWEDGKIDLGAFLKHAISEGWIITDTLQMEGSYSDTTQVYQALVQALVNGIRDDLDFQKLVYRYVLEAEIITEKEMCLLLYDQGVFDKSEDSYTFLLNDDQQARGFIYQKIYDIELTPAMLAFDTCSAACVITDPNTGDVKALVSYPSYDANQIMNSKYYASIINNDSKPLFNRATQQTSAPGSTYKPLAAIASIQEGLTSIDEQILDHVIFDKVVPNPSCWSSVSHGYMNAVSAIGQSCNYYFYEMGYRATINGVYEEDDQHGLALLRNYAESFGFGETTGIEIGEATPHISDESSVRSFIGQGTNNYTPTQVNRYTSALANRGTVYELSLVDKVTNAKGAVMQEYTPTVVNKVKNIDPSTWNTVFQGMKQVCENVTYQNVFTSLGITVAGKSGTAQESELKPDHAWFTGFAPYDDPQVAVTVLISCGYGSTNIVDTFRDSIAAYFNLPLYKTIKSPEEEDRHALYPINYSIGTEHTDDGED